MSTVSIPDVHDATTAGRCVQSNQEAVRIRIGNPFSVYAHKNT
jgi:hypothetical protein